MVLKYILPQNVYQIFHQDITTTGIIDMHELRFLLFWMQALVSAEVYLWQG